MQENEFEKQVQQKMEELKLVPSAAVWQKIEPQIKKEKRRRWILILIPLLIALSYGGYEFLNTDKSASTAQNSLTSNSNERKNITAPSNAAPAPTKNRGTVKEITEADAASANIQIDSARKIIPPRKKTYNNYNAINLRKTTGTGKVYIKHTLVKNEKSRMDVKVTGQGEKANEETNIENPIAMEKESPKENKAVVAKDTTATKTATAAKKEAPVTNETKTITKNRSRWNWGVSFAGGVSGMKGLNGILGNEDKSTSLASQGTTGPAVTTGYPSPIRSAIAFAAGLSAEKKILPKIIFTTGLNYKLLTTKNKYS